SELGAERVAEFAYGDVGSPVWERLHAEWNSRVWPTLLELSGARRTQAAAARVTADTSAAKKLSVTDSNTPIAMSLGAADTAPRVLLVPQILTNAVGAETVEVRVKRSRELQAHQSPRRTRHVQVVLPGVAYRAGDHIGVCPKNDEGRVERLAHHLGAELE